MLSSRLLSLGFLLFGLSWIAYDHYRPWVNFHSEALACGSLVLLFTSCLLDRRQPMVWPVVGGWILAAAAMPWLWWLFGIGLFAGDALVTSMYLLALCGAVLVGYSWARHAQAKQQFAWGGSLAVAVVAAAIVSAAIGLLQWLCLTEPFGMYMVHGDPGDRAMGNLGQPNQLGTFLLMGLAALLSLFESRKLSRFSFAVGVGFLTLVLVLSQSRSAMLGAAAVALFLWIKTAHLARLRRGALLGWMLAFACATAALPLVSEAMLLGGGRDMASLTHTMDRVTIWSQVLAGIADAPWFGYGWNQTPTAHAAGALSVSGSMTYSYAHSIVLDLLAWTGVPLGLFWIGLIAYWLCSRIVRVSTLAAITAMAALLPLAVHSLLEYPFAYAYFLVLGGLLIGIVEAAYPRAQARAVQRRWVWIMMLPWTMAGTYLCYEYLLVEEDFRIVRFENLRIGQTPAEYEVPHVWMLSHMAEMLKASRARPKPGMGVDEIERLRKVALRFPWGALHLRYAGALALNGDHQGAARQMRVIRGMFGEHYYAAAKQELLEQQARYPQAGALALP